MQIKNVKNPQWANAEHTLIDVTLETDAYGEIPFSASPNDVEAHGRGIFADVVAGKFGPIAEYVPPVVPVVVPQEISKAQGIVVMSEVPVGDSNLWLTVKAYFDTEADEISRDLFKAVTVFNRQSPMLNALKDRFGLDDAALDLLFIEGAQVVV